MFIFDKAIDIILDWVALRTYEKERRRKFVQKKAILKERDAYITAVQNVLKNENLDKAIIREGEYSSVEMEELLLRLFDVSRASISALPYSAVKTAKKSKNDSRNVQIKEFIITSNCDFLLPHRSDLLPKNIVTALKIPTTIGTNAHTDCADISQAIIDAGATGLNLNYAN